MGHPTLLSKHRQILPVGVFAFILHVVYAPLLWVHPSGISVLYCRVPEQSSGSVAGPQGRSEVGSRLLKNPARNGGSPYSHLPSKMSSIQAPVCVHHHDPLHNESVLSGAIFHRSTLSEEENTMGRKRAESVAQYKLPTYQAAAVVVRTIWS